MGASNIYQKLKAAIGNDFGVCGLMGNLKAESNLQANNLQNTYSKKFGMTDEEYTKAVDNGSYTNFVKDSAGYGLAQWTYWSRKQKLLQYAQAYGCSIGDENMQVDFMIGELMASYPSVMNVLKTVTSIREASDIVLTRYEAPADQSNVVKIKRASYGEALYAELVEGGKEVAKYSRAEIVALANSWNGKESDGSHKFIIDIYNSFLPHPRGYAVKYTDAWCATFASALAIQLGYTKIIPVECGCPEWIKIAKTMGIWEENDGYIPKPGDYVLYDWNDSGAGDNTGTPDHIGIVVSVSGNNFTVREGNKNDAVGVRTMTVNGKYIRGFVCPKYTEDGATSISGNKTALSVEEVAKKVINGDYGNGTDRQKVLEVEGYNYSEVQTKVNEILNGSADKSTTVSTTTTKEVKASEYAKSGPLSSLSGVYKTTTDLYMRDGAGTNKKALVIIPSGTAVNCYGYYTTVSGDKWLYIQVTIKGVKYTGFSYSGYLLKQ